MLKTIFVCKRAPAKAKLRASHSDSQRDGAETAAPRIGCCAALNSRSSTCTVTLMYTTVYKCIPRAACQLFSGLK